jgi:hypothetical protein
MQLSAPTQIVWIISLVLGLVGLIGALVTIPFVTGIAFWLVLIGLIIMLVATMLKGM